MTALAGPDVFFGTVGLQAGDCSWAVVGSDLAVNNLEKRSGETRGGLFPGEYLGACRGQIVDVPGSSLLTKLIVSDGARTECVCEIRGAALSVLVWLILPAEVLVPLL